MPTEVDFSRRRYARLRQLIFFWGFLITLICLTPSPAPAQEGVRIEDLIVMDQERLTEIASRPHVPDPPVQPPEEKRRLFRTTLRTTLERSQSDTAKLAVLTKELREELDKPNVNLLSGEIRNRETQIDELSKKIQSETKGLPALSKKVQKEMTWKRPRHFSW